MSETNVTDLLESALQVVNATGEQLNSALQELTNHLTDPDAHEDIQEILKEILNNNSVWTEEKIKSLITTELNKHRGTAFDLAHPGWDSKKGEIQVSLDTITRNLTQLTSRVETLENAGDTSGGSGGASGDLKTILDEIYSRYDLEIQDLTDRIIEAQEANNTDLVETYKEALVKTLDKRNQELQEAINNYQATQPGAVVSFKEDS